MSRTHNFPDPIRPAETSGPGRTAVAETTAAPFVHDTPAWRLCELENLPVLAFRRQRWLASPWLIYAVGDAFVGKWDRREIGGKPAAPVAIPRAPGRLLRVRPDSTNAGRGGCKCAAQGDWIEAPYLG